MFFCLDQQPLLSVALDKLIVQYRKPPHALEAHDFLVQYVVVQRLADQACHLLLHAFGKMSIHTFHGHELRDWRLGTAARIALGHVLVPGSVVHRKRHQHRGFCGRGVVAGLDNLVRLVKVERVVLLDRHGHQKIGFFHADQLVRIDHHGDRLAQNAER